jgi:hypothetical protein
MKFRRFDHVLIRDQVHNFIFGSHKSFPQVSRALSVAAIFEVTIYTPQAFVSSFCDRRVSCTEATLTTSRWIQRWARSCFITQDAGSIIFVFAERSVPYIVGDFADEHDYRSAIFTLGENLSGAPVIVVLPVKVLLCPSPESSCKISTSMSLQLTHS